MTRYATSVLTNKVSTPPRLPTQQPRGRWVIPKASFQPAYGKKGRYRNKYGWLAKVQRSWHSVVWLVVVVVSQLVSHLQRVRTSDLRITTKYTMCTLGWESPMYDQYPRSYHRSPSQSLCSEYASGNLNPDSLRGLPRNGWVLLTWILVRNLIRFRTALNFPRLVNQSLVLCCTNDWLESLWLHPARWSF